MAAHAGVVKNALHTAQVQVQSVIGILLAPNCASAIGEPKSVKVVQGDAGQRPTGRLPTATDLGLVKTSTKHPEEKVEERFFLSSSLNATILKAGLERGLQIGFHRSAHRAAAMSLKRRVHSAALENLNPQSGQSRRS